METVFLALGSNIGNRDDNLRAAIIGLSAELSLTSVSPVYETTPMYVSDQPRFLNMAVRGYTELHPDRLLALIKILERQLGRTPSKRFGPRLIDIDILFYGMEATKSEDLVIPHPALHERLFVLRPLSDIAPHWVHPRIGSTVLEMLAELPEKQGEISKVGSLQ